MYLCPLVQQCLQAGFKSQAASLKAKQLLETAVGALRLGGLPLVGGPEAKALPLGAASACGVTCTLASTC